MQDVYLLDTTIASIAWDGGHPNHKYVRKRLADLGEDPITVCVITVAEVLYGLNVSQGADRDRHDAVRRAMLEYKIWDVDRHTAQVYANLRGRLFELYSPRDKRGRLTKKQPEELRDRTTGKELGIQENDLWIVSTAVQYDIRFITSDKKLERILDVAKEVRSYDRAEIWSLATSEKE
jgi:tRNA(fMet)-specific endonuclease VapC